MTFVGWFVVIFGVFVLGLLTVALVRKLLEVRRVRRWPATTGRVVESRAQTRRKSKREPEIGTVARVRYEYTVRGRKFRGRRISVGEEATNVDVLSRLQRYVPGTMVTVYYNPSNPDDAVLERDLPPNFATGIGMAYAVFVALFGFALFAVTSLPRTIAKSIANPSAAFVVSVIGSLSAFLIVLAIALQRQAAAARAWRTTTGVVVKSHTHRYVDANITGPGWTTYYRPRILYEYQVDGQTYRHDRLSFGGVIGTGLLVAARAAAKYPEDSTVTVYYNPKEPADSVLLPTAKAVWVLWLVAALFVVTAWILAK